MTYLIIAVTVLALAEIIVLPFAGNGFSFINAYFSMFSTIIHVSKMKLHFPHCKIIN